MKAFPVIFLGMGFVFASGALAKESGEMMFCKFGPKSKSFEMKPVSSNGCSGAVKVQSLMWTCTTQAQIEKYNETFRVRLNQMGEQQCQKACEKRGPGCSGVFRAVSRCGLLIES